MGPEGHKARTSSLAERGRGRRKRERSAAAADEIDALFTVTLCGPALGPASAPAFVKSETKKTYLMLKPGRGQSDRSC